MKILAVYTIKGGVGKTATAVNLAAEAASSGERVLLWDLDPQGASSFYFRVQPKIKGGSAKLIKGDTDLLDHVKETEFEGLDLMPADFSYRNLDILLDEARGSTKRLRKVLKGLEDDYDLVLLDCPPGITLLSENVMHAADALLVPVIPTPLSLRTLDQLQDFLAGQKIGDLQVLPFLSMVDRRKSLHREIADSFHKQHKGSLKKSIPNASVIERMGLEEAPVLDYAPSSDAAEAFHALWREVKRRVL